MLLVNILQTMGNVQRSNGSLYILNSKLTSRKSRDGAAGIAAGYWLLARNPRGVEFNSR
jgi:hypothetical protein